jgi:2,3-bisphosphoglycerate-independent phosphoglycerate mutase
MQLELNEEEKRELLELVQEEYKEVQTEFHHTKEQNYRDILKRRHVVLEGLLKRLQGNPPAAGNPPGEPG